MKTAFRTAKTAAEKTEALFAFAKSLKVDETYSTLVDALREAGEFSAAAETESIFGVCLETLEALSEMKGSTEDDFFRELLRLAFSFGSVGSLPSSPEALAAGDVTFTRLKKVRHLFLIGVATDSFPRSTATAPLFSVRERALISRLGDDSPLFFAKPTHDLTREEYFLFYLAASVPRDALHLTYPAQNLDGSLARASIFITRIKHLFPALTESEFDEEAALPLSASELYRYLNRTKNETDDFTRFARALYKKHVALPCPKSDEETAKCRDRLTVGDEAASITVSQAKLAAYAKCPYSYFLQYKLFLSEEPQAKPDASLRGTIVHNALEHLFYPLSQGRLFKPKLDAITPEEIDREFDAQHRALTDAGYEPDEWDERWFDDLRRTTHRLVHSMKEELRVGEFRPAFFEADLMRTLTPIERILKNGTKMRISGKADRIDLARDAESGRVFARVVDYKTGEHKMDCDELLNGFDTQLLLYLFTLSENGIGKEYPSITPAAAYYLRAHTPPASAREADAKKDSVDACTFLRSGVFLSEPEAIRASVCEGATDKDNLSIHYDSKGMPKSSGILADGEQMQILSDAVLNYAKDTAEDIVDGKFACLPLWKDEDTNESCEYCPYHAICRYEGEAIRLQKKANKDTFFADLKEGGIHRG